MKIKIADRIYPVAVLDDLTLKMLLQLEQETAEFGHPMRANDIRLISDRMRKLDNDEERAADPDVLWLTATVIWSARKLAGEDVTFDQAVDFPMSDLSYIAEPQDRLPDPTKPRNSRKSSGAAGKRPAKARPSKTSGRASASA